MLRAMLLVHFLKNAEIVCSVDEYRPPLRNTYNNALNVITDLGLGTHLFVKVPRPGNNE